MRLPVFKITRRTLSIIILILVLELLLLGFIVYKQQGMIGKLRQDVKEKKEEIARYSELYREIPKLEGTLNSLRYQLELTQWNLPSQAYIPTFLREIEGWARQCRVKVTNISPQQVPTPTKTIPRAAAEEEVGVKRGAYKEEAKPEEEKPLTPYEMITLNLQVEGNFYSIHKFIDGFRRFPKALSLAKLDITPQEKKEGPPTVRVSLLLNISVLSRGMTK